MSASVPLPLPRLLLRTILVPLLLIGVLTFVIVTQVDYLVRIQASVEHQDAVLRQSHRVQGLIFERESSLRGYQITGESAFLEPYERGRNVLEDELRDLERLVPDSPEQRMRVAELRDLAASWEQYAEELLRRRREGRDTTALARSGTGKHLTNRMRDVLDAFRVEEERLRRVQTAEADAARRRSFGIFGLLSVLLGGVLSFYTRREIVNVSRQYSALLREREAATEALRASEQRFRRLAENAPDIIYRVKLKPEQRFEYVSPVVSQVVGYTPEEHYQDPDLGRKMIHPADRQKLEGLLQDPRPVAPLSLRWVHRNGRIVWTDHHITPVYDEAGEVEALEGIGRDVTSQRELEQQLYQSQELLRSVLDSVNECVVACDREGKITYANRAAHQLYSESGRVVDTDAWLHHLRFYRPDGVTLLRAEERPLRRALVDGEVRNAEVVAAAEGSTPRRFLVSGRAMSDAEGRKTGAVIVLHDITEEVEARRALRDTEAQLFQSQKLEAVGRLAGGIAHDFNNMLAAILGYTEILLWRKDLDADFRSHLGEIRAAATRATNLTRQLLAFSRREVVAPQRLDLNETVPRIHGMLRRLIGEDLELVTIPSPMPALVLMDPNQIEQVLINLVVNARDAMPQGGKITIEIQNVTLDADYAAEHPEAVPGDYVLLAVSDTGHGMDRETQERIFEPFFTTKEVGKGTGLGLSTLYGIVKQNRGHVGVYSEPGKGTTFKLYLPRCEPSPREARTGETRAPLPRGKETVLLVEDEEIVRKVARQVLTMCGYCVLEAMNGHDALLLARQHEGDIHLLLTDVVMPQMSGRELAEELTRIRPETRVLFMSGYTDDAVVRHGVLSAEVSFIQKPFAAARLAMKVREVLDA